MKSKGYSFAYWSAFLVTVLAILIVILTVGASAHQPAIYLASVVLVVTCIAFLIIVPTILLSMLRNSRRTADYLEHLANRPKE
jgi:hypothetical protein